MSFPCQAQALRRFTWLRNRSCLAQTLVPLAWRGPVPKASVLLKAILEEARPADDWEGQRTIYVRLGEVGTGSVLRAQLPLLHIDVVLVTWAGSWII